MTDKNFPEDSKMETQLEHLLDHGTPAEREFALRHCVQGDLLDHLVVLADSLSRILDQQSKNLRLRYILINAPLYVYCVSVITSTVFIILLINGQATLTVSLITMATLAFLEGIASLFRHLTKKSRQAYLTRKAEYLRLDAEYELLNSVMDTVR
jgi:hypothetical protein